MQEKGSSETPACSRSRDFRRRSCIWLGPAGPGLERRHGSLSALFLSQESVCPPRCSTSGTGGFQIPRLFRRRLNMNDFRLVYPSTSLKSQGSGAHQMQVYRSFSKMAFARRSAEAFSGFDTGPDTVPQLSAPPTQPQVQTAERLEPPTMPPTILGSLYPPPSQCQQCGDVGDPGFYQLQQIQQPARPGVQRQQPPAQ